MSEIAVNLLNLLWKSLTEWIYVFFVLVYFYFFLFLSFGDVYLRNVILSSV